MNIYYCNMRRITIYFGIISIANMQYGWDKYE